MMDLNSFQHCIDIYGGNLSRWPRELLQAATQRLQSDDRAQILSEQALVFDEYLHDALAHDAPVAASFVLRAKLLALPDQDTPLVLAWLSTPRHWAAGLTLCLLLGLVVGMNNFLPSPVDHETQITAAFLAPDQAIED